VSESALQIVQLEAENVKRLRAVEVTPEGALVVVGGRNGQGKTSLLDSIAYALGGKDLVCERPLREGAEAGHVTVDLGELVVRRDFGPGGTQRLTVSNREGARFPSPQTLLDALAGQLTFDPLAFARMAPREQAETLRALLGLDFTALDGRRLGAYEERTAVNREVKRLEAQLVRMPRHEGAPAREVSVAALMEQLDEIATKEREIEAQERRARDLEVQAEAASERVRAIDLEMGDLRERMDGLAADRQSFSARGERLRGDAMQSAAGTAAARKMLPDVAPIRAAIASAEERNRLLRENDARTGVEDALARVRAQSEGLTREIEAIDADKAGQIAAAKLPVEGLSFDAERVLLRGLPFEQASSAEQLRVSIAMGAAMSPRLRVMLVRDGSLLDEESLRLVAEMAAEHGLQVWMERVGDGAECQVVIEDGAVREPAPADPRDADGFVHAGKAAAELVDAMVKGDPPAANADAPDPFAATDAEMAAEQERAEGTPISRAQREHLVAVLAERGKRERADALRFVGTVLGRAVRSTEDLTAGEYARLLAAMGTGAPAEQGALL